MADFLNEATAGAMIRKQSFEAFTFFRKRNGTANLKSIFALRKNC